LKKKIDFGVIIHEGRFVYQALDLQKVADLGQWWEKKTSLPIPLGCIAIRRDLGQQRAGRIQSLIAKSIDHAFLHPRAGAAYIQKHAQEMAPDVIQQHIDLYVNDYSKDIGETGTTAVTTFFEFAVRAGLMPKPNAPLFAC
jgi:1,4-dihydroxy-6-naphthoate synthase